MSGRGSPPLVAEDAGGLGERARHHGIPLGQDLVVDAWLGSRAPDLEEGNSGGLLGRASAKGPPPSGDHAGPVFECPFGGDPEHRTCLGGSQGVGATCESGSDIVRSEDGMRALVARRVGVN